MKLKIIYFNPDNWFWSTSDNKMKRLAEELLTNDQIKCSNEGVINEVRKLILMDKLDRDNLVIQWIREDLNRMDVMYFTEDALIKDWPVGFCSMGMEHAKEIVKLMVYKRNPKLKSKLK